MKIIFRISLVIFLLSILYTNTWAQDVRSQLRQIANDLAKQIEAKGKKRVVIASFLDLKNQETELGRYMADKFSIGLGASSLEITDRSQLGQLMLDNKLGADRILDPKTIPILGKITGAEVMIIGNYTSLDNAIDITVKAIDLERGLRLAVAEGTVARTSEINKLLNEVTENKEEGSNSGGSAVLNDKKSSPDCEAKRVCKVCLTNATDQPIEAKIDATEMFGHDLGTKPLYIQPKKTECWPEVNLYSYIDTNDSHRWVWVYHSVNGNWDRSKNVKFMIERCKVYQKTISK